MGDDGSADLQYVLNVAQSIGQSMQKRLIIVDKSVYLLKCRQGEMTVQKSWILEALI